MPKNLVHVCSKCDAQFPRWSGRCESCGSWGIIVAKNKGLLDKKIAAYNKCPSDFVEIKNELMNKK